MLDLGAISFHNLRIEQASLSYLPLSILYTSIMSPLRHRKLKDGSFSNLVFRDMVSLLTQVSVSWLFSGLLRAVLVDLLYVSS